MARQAKNFKNLNCKIDKEVSDVIKEIFEKHNFSFSKQLGQNFLINPSVCPKIAEMGNAKKGFGVIEIGTGIGVLTNELAKRADKVVAIEIDDRLMPVLDETLAEFDNVKIINADVMDVDLHKLINEEFNGLDIAVCANLPYYITTPIIMGLFESHVPLENITVMVQKEVASRMQAGPGTKDYGALSLAVQYYAEPYLVANVPPNCFMPRPNVGSAVIKLTVHENAPVTVRDEQLMFRLIRASFNQRRKTLVNGLTNASELHVSKEQVLDALEKMNLSPTIRGEALTLEQFAELSNIL